jgi:hypothetical protein
MWLTRFIFAPQRQCIDELPMLYAATIGMFICIETHFGKQGRWFPIALTAWIGKKQQTIIHLYP